MLVPPPPREPTTDEWARQLGEGSILANSQGVEFVVEDILGGRAFGRGPLGLYGRLPLGLKPRLKSVS